MRAQRVLADLDLLDIGGGFPIAYGDTMQPIRESATRSGKPEEAAARRAHDRRTGAFPRGSSGHAVATVVGRAQREGRWWYYLDDGMYGSYNGQLYDHARYPIDVPGGKGPTHPSVFADPRATASTWCARTYPCRSCNSATWSSAGMMGAYTACSATDFNFIPRAKIVALNVQAGTRHAD